MLKPIQMAGFDLDAHIEGRKQFTTQEWVDALIRSIGLDPAQLGKRAKLFQLTRIIPYCERNYNLVEPGPRDTGKNKRPKPDIVDILKNYMANKSFSRGIEQVTAEASLAFVGNTSHDVSYMINRSDLFEDLPSVYHDSAFIDRIHVYIPGWEVDIIRDGVLKTYSGLMKIIFHGKDATAEEEAKILEFAMELRKRVKDQLYRIDETFARTHFRFRQKAGAWRGVTTLEEVNFPRTYHSRDKVPLDEGAAPAEEPTDSASALASQQASPGALASENATPVQPKPAEDKPSGPFVGFRE